MVVDIKLTIMCKKTKHEWRGEEVTFDVTVNGPELIKAIDLNAIKVDLVAEAEAKFIEKMKQEEVSE